MLLLVSSSEISEIPKEVKSASGGSQFGSPLTKPPPPPLLDVTGLFIGGNLRLAECTVLGTVMSVVTSGFQPMFTDENVHG